MADLERCLRCGHRQCQCHQPDLTVEFEEMLAEFWRSVSTPDALLATVGDTIEFVDPPLVEEEDEC